MQNKYIPVTLAGLICVHSAWAGDLDSPAGPDSPTGAMFTLESIYQRLSTGAGGSKRGTGFSNPVSGPASTGHTLDDIMLVAPVVDDTNTIKGIITVDDMIDVSREEAIEDLSHLGGLELAEPGTAPSLRTRLPSILIALLGGLAAALILSLFEDRTIPLIILAFYLPLVLRAAQDISMISQAVVLEEIGGKDPGWREIFLLMWKEMRVVLLISLILAVLGGLVAAFWEGYFRFGLTIGLTLFTTVVLGTMVGIFLPLISRRFKGELRYTQARFSSLFVGLAALAVYLGMATAIL